MTDLPSDFTGLLAAANQTKVGRNPGQWMRAAVETWRQAPPELARLLDAAFALELKLGRRVAADDEDWERAKLAEMEAATAAVKERVAR